MKLVIKNGKKLSMGLFLEQLRYAGIIHIEEGKDDITLYPPAKVLVKNWAEQNKGRMASFGIVAEIIKEGRYKL